MEIIIRKAIENDFDSFVKLSEELSRFNRSNHHVKCKYDDYHSVLKSIREQAVRTFKTRSEDVSIFIAQVNNVPKGYALVKIYTEAETAENGTGRMGLLDEIYVDESVRGNGIGNQLVDEVISWMRAKGITRIKLHAYSWNKNATALYEKLGFSEYAVSYEKFI